MNRRRATERGAASVLLVALIGLVLVLGLAASFVTAVAAAHRGAQSAADLAALAGATARQRGQEGCAAAAGLAADNRAVLIGCSVEGADVVVTVRVSSPELFGLDFVIDGKARAGPTRADLRTQVR